MNSFFFQELTTRRLPSERLNTFFEKFIAIDLAVFCISIYFLPPYDKNIFLLTSILSLMVLLVWCYLQYQFLNPLPKALTIGSLSFILFVAFCALASQNQKLALIYLLQLRFLVLSRLLYNAPLQDRSRKHVIAIFFLSGAAAGLVGILQYFGLMNIVGERPYGFSEHPITYALILSVVCSSAIIMVFIPKTRVFTSRKGFYFLAVVIFLTFYGVILSQTRGAWIALLVAPFITIFLHNRKKAFFYFLYFMLMFAVVSLTSATIKQIIDSADSKNGVYCFDFIQRAISIITSIFKENVTGSTGNRLELWKGALLIFKQYPFAGCGLGDFDLHISRLISLGKLNPATSCSLHAHNIYLQALSTCGILGLLFMTALFMSLLKWGTEQIKDHAGIGGYAVILITLLFMVAGLTYSPHGDTMFMGACCLMIGLLGSYGIKKSFADSILPN